MEFAPYVLFDELYDQFNSFSKVSREQVLNVRLLGMVSGYEAQNNIVEILSPTRADGLPCVLVDVSLLSEDFMRSLVGSGDGSLDRLVQFIGTLSVGGRTQSTWCLRAISHCFMDGVDLRAYEDAARLTRPYAHSINF